MAVGFLDRDYVSCSWQFSLRVENLYRLNSCIAMSYDATRRTDPSRALVARAFE